MALVRAKTRARERTPTTGKQLSIHQGPTTTNRSRTRTRRDRRRRTIVARSHKTTTQLAEWRQVQSRPRKCACADTSTTLADPERATALVATNPPAAGSRASEQPAPEGRPQTAPIQPNSAPAPSHPTSASTCTLKGPSGRDGETQASLARTCNLMHRATGGTMKQIRLQSNRTVALTETTTSVRRTNKQQNQELQCSLSWTEEHT